MRVTRHRTPNFVGGRGGHVPRGIVVHTTVGSSADTIDWFMRRESDASTHYLVRLDGVVAQFVEERDTALHARWVRNPATPLVVNDWLPLYTIGIEFEDRGDPEGVERPATQYQAGGRLIGEVAFRWGIPLDRGHVVAHREIDDGTACPGNLDVDRLLADARSSSRPDFELLS
jgi:N-acetyl-anhydromuramyl-L-alanine amidase AmpD